METYSKGVFPLENRRGSGMDLQPPALQQMNTFMNLPDPKLELAFKDVPHPKISNFFVLAAYGQSRWASSSNFQWKRALTPMAICLVGTSSLLTRTNTLFMMALKEVRSSYLSI